jgi:hypothetical protein
VHRKVGEGFRQNAGLSGEEAAAALDAARANADIIARQVEVYRMFGRAFLASHTRFLSSYKLKATASCVPVSLYKPLSHE